ncbi:MAG: MFS transporter [Chloroflexota bacterium]|nr:MFS transporter [Chloroflexota bacterium]MDE2886420.1 MFS transporter [Chloroflexota bacterium]
MHEQQHQQIPRLWPFKNVFYGWAIVGTSVVVTFAQVPMYGPVLSVFVTPIEQELGWARWETAMAFTIGSLGGSIGSALVGNLLDRYGARAAVVVSGMLVTGALLGLAAMQEVWQFWGLFGLGRTAALAGVNLGVTVAIGNWFIRKRGRALSFMTVGLRAGQAFVPLIIATPLILAYSWRHAYLALAVMAFVFVALPGWMFIRRRPEDFGLRPDGAQPDEVAARSTDAPGSDPDGEVSFTLAEAKRTPAFWLLTFATMTVIFAQTSVNVHAVPSVEDRGVSQAFSGAFVFIIMGTAALSAYVWGALMDRFHVRWATIAATVFSAVAMIVLLFADDILTATVFGVLFGLGTGAWTISQILLFANYFGRRHLGAIRGLSQLLAAPLSSFGAVLAGLIHDLTDSYTLAFLIFFGALVTVVVALLLAKPPRKPTGPPPS